MNGSWKYSHTRMKAVRSGKRQFGLTLIELLVAISVLAFVAVLGWRGLDSIVRARVALNADLEQTRGMQLAFAQMQNDFAQVVPASSLPNLPVLTIDENRITLIRRVYADDQPSRLQVVNYRLKDGVLTRRESTATRDLVDLEKHLIAMQTGSDSGQDVAIKSGIAALTTRLWGPNGWGPANTNPGAPATPGGAPAMPPASAPPGGGAAAQPPVNQASFTGLHVALQLQGRETSMHKIFLLGAV